MSQDTTTDASHWSPPAQQPPGMEQVRSRWEAAYRSGLAGERERRNRSGVAVKPLYGPWDWDGSHYLRDLGVPGQPPYTRGVHSSMHRGQPWRPRLVVGFGLPEDYNRRMRELYALGLTGLYVSPCNSHMRGYDPDEVERELLGTCGTLVSTSADMATCLEGLPFDTESLSLGDTAPYTLSAMMLHAARARGIPWPSLMGTTNQSDYLSHYAALHMFFRIGLAGQRRALLDHIVWMNHHVPRWNPLSVVGQHTQQAGATPAESMGFAIAAAIQYAEDLIGCGLQPDAFLPRVSFFFDVSISLFEEVAKFRAGRRIWQRIAAERLGAKDPRSMRFRFHAQTSGSDLTRQQPLNNIARVAVQAMAGIFGGLQSLHTDSYDEAISAPSAQAARIAVATQNILRDEAHLDDVIDPLGGSYYVEALTDEMEQRILAVIRDVDECGGMFAAVQSGYVQQRIGKSALEFQNRIDSGEQVWVGVNRFAVDDAGHTAHPAPERPDPARLDAYLANLQAFRAARDRQAVTRALDDLARAYDSPAENTYAATVNAIAASATHGEICQRVRSVAGSGTPLVVV